MSIIGQNWVKCGKEGLNTVFLPPQIVYQRLETNDLTEDESRVSKNAVSRRNALDECFEPFIAFFRYCKVA